MIEKFVIAIEPSNDLDLDLDRLKKVFKKYSINDYIEHPNHLTILHGYFIKENLFTAIEKIDSDEFSIKTNKIECFPEDQLTNSKTLYISLAHEPNLFQLQKEILSKIKKEIVNKDLEKFFDNTSNYVKNLKRYSYPYVGDDWVPHFTICSLNDINTQEFKEFINNPVLKIMKVKKITVFKVSGSKHDKVKELKL